MKYILIGILFILPFMQGCVSSNTGVRETADGRYYVVYIKKLIKKDDSVVTTGGDSLSVSNVDDFILVNQTSSNIKIGDFIFRSGEALDLSGGNNNWILEDIRSGALDKYNAYAYKLKDSLWIVRNK